MKNGGHHHYSYYSGYQYRGYYRGRWGDISWGDMVEVMQVDVRSEVIVDWRKALEQILQGRMDEGSPWLNCTNFNFKLL